MKIKDIKEYPLTPDEAIRKMEIEDGSTSPVFAYPTIQVDEPVVIFDKHLSGREELKNRVLTVKEIYPKDLGDMTVYIVKFKQTNDVPYLAHHFYTYVENEE